MARVLLQTVEHPFESGLVDIELFVLFEDLLQEADVFFVQVVVWKVVVRREGLDVDVLPWDLKKLKWLKNQQKAFLFYKVEKNSGNRIA